MQIPILIEPIAGNGYRARGGEPLALAVEAPTREGALAKLKEQLQARLRNGAEIVPLELTPTTPPSRSSSACSKTIRSSKTGRSPWRNTGGKSTNIPSCHDPPCP
jgi:hypothetical protein